MELHDWTGILHVIYFCDHWALNVWAVFFLALSNQATIKVNSWIKFYNSAAKTRREALHSLNRKQSKVIALVFFSRCTSTTGFLYLGLIFMFPFLQLNKPILCRLFTMLVTSSRLCLITMLGAYLKERYLSIPKCPRRTATYSSRGQK